MRAACWTAGMVAVFLVLAAVATLLPGSAAAQAVKPARGSSLSPSAPPVPPGAEFAEKMAYARFSDIDRAAVGTFLAKHYAEELRRFRETAEFQPDAAVGIMTDLIQTALGLMELKKSEPDRFKRIIRQRELEDLARKQAEVLKARRSQDRGQATAELRKTLVEAFVVKHELMLLDVDRMQAELEKLKLLIEKRQQSQKEIIDRRMNDLIQATSGLAW